MLGHYTSAIIFYSSVQGSNLMALLKWVIYIHLFHLHATCIVRASSIGQIVKTCWNVTIAERQFVCHLNTEDMLPCSFWRDEPDNAARRVSIGHHTASASRVGWLCKALPLIQLWGEKRQIKLWFIYYYRYFIQPGTLKAQVDYLLEHHFIKLNATRSGQLLRLMLSSTNTYLQDVPLLNVPIQRSTDMKILCPAIIAFLGSARPHNYGTKPKFFEEASQIIIVPLTRPIQNVWQVQRGFGHEKRNYSRRQIPKICQLQ